MKMDIMHLAYWIEEENRTWKEALSMDAASLAALMERCEAFLEAHPLEKREVHREIQETELDRNRNRFGASLSRCVAVLRENRQAICSDEEGRRWLSEVGRTGIARIEEMERYGAFLSGAGGAGAVLGIREFFSVIADREEEKEGKGRTEEELCRIEKRWLNQRFYMWTDATREALMEAGVPEGPALDGRVLDSMLQQVKGAGEPLGIFQELGERERKLLAEKAVENRKAIAIEQQEIPQGQRPQSIFERLRSWFGKKEPSDVFAFEKEASLRIQGIRSQLSEEDLERLTDRKQEPRKESRYRRQEIVRRNRVLSI